MLKKFFCLAALTLIAGHPPVAQATSNLSPSKAKVVIKACANDCVLVERSGDQLFYTALNSSGVRTRTIAYNLKSGARDIKVGFADVDSDNKYTNPFTVQANNLADSGVTATTSVTKYETKTEIIIVTITFVKDRFGNLLDVIINEKRLPRATVQER